MFKVESVEINQKVNYFYNQGKASNVIWVKKKLNDKESFVLKFI